MRECEKLYFLKKKKEYQERKKNKSQNLKKNKFILHINFHNI